MSLDDCIRRGIEGGGIDRQRGDEARAAYQQYFEELRPHLGPEAAASEAGRRVFAAKQWALKEKRRWMLLAAKATTRLSSDLREFRGIRGGFNVGRGLAAFWEADPTQPRVVENVEGRYAAIRSAAHGRMDEMLRRFSRGTFGQRRGKAQMRNVVRELFGENTGDKAAREIAQAWKEASEELRRRFNAAGGHIPKREDWGLPQHHSASAIRAAGRTDAERFAAWRAEILPRIDTAKMIDEVTGLPLAGPRLEIALREAFDAIMTDGWAKKKPTMGAAGRALANRRADHRFFVFKSAEDWMAYQERFGHPDPFSTMMAHVDHMARDIAQMEIFGPNPTAAQRWLEQEAKKIAAIEDARSEGRPWRTGQVNAGINMARTMAAHFTGSVNAPADAWWARTFSDVRNVLTSAQLGAAALSAISDISFQQRAAAFNGLSATRALRRHASLLNPANVEDRKLAVRLGLIAEEWATVAAAQNRYVGEIATSEWAKRLSHSIMRVSGLSAWTQAGRWAFGMELLGTLADHRGRKFSDLPAFLQRSLRRYRLADAWDTVRATPVYRHKGAEFLRPEDIAARADLDEATRSDLSNALADFIATETEYAVPSASLRARARIVGSEPPGQIMSEIRRSAAMYKSFPVTLMHTHLMRGVTEMVQRDGLGRFNYLAALFISTTVMGALAMNMKEISKGRDPRDMTDSKAWAAAAMQGGGLGIWGDFFFADATRYGQGWAEMLAGPVVGLADDVGRETIVANVQRAMTGEETQVPQDVLRLLRRYTPGTSVWQWRVALERTVWDQLEYMVNPNAARRFADRERDQFREYGNEYWWSPGQARPRRAPELAEAAGG